MTSPALRRLLDGHAASTKAQRRRPIFASASWSSLGVQSVDGQNVYAYSFVTHGIPATLYVAPDSLPVQSVVNYTRGTTTIKYSKYNKPISIEAPQ
jgi:hypothetical protein